MTNRRNFLLGLGATAALIAAPKIVRPESLMRIKPYDLTKSNLCTVDFEVAEGRILGVIYDAFGNVAERIDQSIFSRTDDLKLKDMFNVEAVFGPMKQDRLISKVEIAMDWFGVKERYSHSYYEPVMAGGDLKVIAPIQCQMMGNHNLTSCGHAKLSI